MTPLPTISIVVPSLDQGRFLGEALQSLVDQEYPALEVIVQDGGSSDDSVADRCPRSGPRTISSSSARLP